MNIPDNLLDFFDKNRLLIDQGDFKQVYKLAAKETFSIGLMTYIFLKAKFEFLNSMTTIPSDFLEKTDITLFEVPDNITKISNYAFYKCLRLANIKLSNLLKTIGIGAFSGCVGLTDICIPDTCISISEDAFENCVSLKSLTIPYNIKTIKRGAFWCCKELSTVYWNATDCFIAGAADDPIFNRCLNLINIKIGSNVKSLPNAVFAGCRNLTSIVIPTNVVNLGHNIFKDCENLTNIVYEGTKKLWDSIKKSHIWNQNSAIEIIYCSDGDLLLDSNL